MAKLVSVSAALLGCVVTIFWTPIVLAQQSLAVNKGLVELETSGSDGISVRIAEDLSRLIDDGGTRRLVPIIGKGSLQNIIDLKYLRGIDVAIVQADVLDYAKEQRLLPGFETSLTYITKLYNEEFHLLTHAGIKDLWDLTDRKVNVDLPNSGTAITATHLFNQLNLRVVATYDSPQLALNKLRKGDIAAVAFVTGKSAPLFTNLTGTDGLHFLPVPYISANNTLYAPARFTDADYPRLVRPNQPIDTVAVGSVLFAADLRQVPERYNNIANFVEVFFTGFQSLRSPGNHPKWSEVNLATELPGWRRFDAAQQWLKRNDKMVRISDPDTLKAMFSAFVDERRRASGGVVMSESEKGALFEQFRVWMNDQTR